MKLTANVSTLHLTMSPLQYRSQVQTRTRSLYLTSATEKDSNPESKRLQLTLWISVFQLFANKCFINIIYYLLIFGLFLKSQNLILF